MSDRVDKPSYHCPEKETDEPCNIHLWTSSLSFGHIALELPNGIYISFWPATCTGKCDIKYEHCECKLFASLKDEVDEKGRPFKSDHIFKLNICAITKWWEDFKNKDPKYHIWSQNCAIVVLRALMEGSPSFRKFNLDHVKVPSVVFKIVTEGYNKNQSISQVPIYCQYLLLCIIRYTLLSLYQSHKHVIKPIFLTVSKYLQDIARFCSNVIFDSYQRLRAYSSTTPLTDNETGSHTTPEVRSGAVDSKMLQTSEYVTSSPPRKVTIETEEPGERVYINIGGTTVELDPPNL